MWLKAILKEHPIRLELICEGLLVYLGNYDPIRGALKDKIYICQIEYFNK